MSRYSVIDIGSNSIRLLNARVEHGKIVESQKSLIMTRLGKGVNATKNLSPETMQASSKAIGTFLEHAKAFGGEFVGAFATSAVRDSQNQDEFKAMILEQQGIMIEIIPGEQEAELGFAGVLAGTQCEEKHLVIDIGGGSTEFIIGDKEGITFSKSYDIGAVRLTELFVTDDPPNQGSLERMRHHVDEVLQDLYDQSFHDLKCVGIAGTITTVAAMDLAMTHYDAKKIQGHRLSIDTIKSRLKQLSEMDLEHRKTIVGLEPKRADIIIAGVTILVKFMERAQIEEIEISDYDNLEGILVTKGILGV